MLVSTLAEAEAVVKQRSDLQWFNDGWTIARVKQTNFPPLHADAFRVGETWYVVIAKYPLTEWGWSIPND